MIKKGNIGKFIKTLQENVSNIKFYISFLNKKLLIIQEIEQRKLSKCF